MHRHIATSQLDQLEVVCSIHGKQKYLVVTYDGLFLIPPSNQRGYCPKCCIDLMDKQLEPLVEM
jgi:hypothetical protein